MAPTPDSVPDPGAGGRGLRGLRVAVVGLGFGAEFVPIYRDHPLVDSVVIADADPRVRARVAEAVGVDADHGSLDEVLADDRVDAVHVVTGLTSHADHVIAALEAGKHVACTVPMALGFDEIERILAARERAGTNYMMMETAVFTREFLLARELLRSGEFGEIVHARGTHYQDMTDWPEYWLGLPPLFYATHAVSPILSLLDARASRVRALGSGRLRPENAGPYDNVFPVESGLVELAGSDVVVELTRSLFQLARAYTESFSLYGDRAGLEWPQLEESESPVLFRMAERGAGRGRPISVERLNVPDRADLLPEPIRRYTRQFADEDQLSFLQGGGHGGSHPHLVHEFLSSIVEGRPPAVDHARAANWTATGIAAHLSATRGGDPVAVPRFD
jgi:predicted dehydrogenase